MFCNRANRDPRVEEVVTCTTRPAMMDKPARTEADCRGDY